MVIQRIYQLILLVAVAMTALSSIWFLEKIDQRSYAKKTFISPSHIKVNSTKVELPDEFVIITWPTGFSGNGYYDIRMRSQLSKSRLRFGFGLMQSLDEEKRRCAGETLDSFLISCDSVSMNSDSISEMNVDSGYWHVFGKEEVNDYYPLYSAAVVLSNKRVLWFEGDSGDCTVFSERITDALDVNVNRFCRSL